MVDFFVLFLHFLLCQHGLMSERPNNSCYMVTNHWLKSVFFFVLVDSEAINQANKQQKCYKQHHLPGEIFLLLHTLKESLNTVP